MHSVKKALVIGVGFLALSLLMTGPALGHRREQRGQPASHGCGRGVPGQTSPPHRTHSHPHGGNHHPLNPPNEHDFESRRERRQHRHYHNHPCPVRRYPPRRTATANVESDASRFERPRDERGGGVTIGLLLLAGLGTFTVLLASRAVRRRLIR